jgi:hypothetical protein
MIRQIIVYLFYFLLCSEITIGQTTFDFFVAANNFDLYDPAFCLIEIKSDLIKLKILNTMPINPENDPNIHRRKTLSTAFHQKINYSSIPDSCLIFFLNEDTFILYQYKQKSAIKIATLIKESFLTHNNLVMSDTKNWIALSLLYWQLETTEKFIREKVDSIQAKKEIAYLSSMKVEDRDAPKREYLLGLLYEKKEDQTDAFKHYLKAGDKGKERIKKSIYNWKIDVDLLSLENDEFKQYYDYMTTADSITGISIKKFVGDTIPTPMQMKTVKNIFKNSKYKTFKLNVSMNSWMFFRHFKELGTITITTEIDKQLDTNEMEIIRLIRITCEGSTGSVKQKGETKNRIKCN